MDEISKIILPKVFLQDSLCDELKGVFLVLHEFYYDKSSIE